MQHAHTTPRLKPLGERVNLRIDADVRGDDAERRVFGMSFDKVKGSLTARWTAEGRRYKICRGMVIV